MITMLLEVSQKETKEGEEAMVGVKVDAVGKEADLAKYAATPQDKDQMTTRITRPCQKSRILI